MRLFDIDGGTLKVVDDLYWDAEDEFVNAVDTLLSLPENSPTLDLTRVSFIFSPFMGHIVRFCMRARETGKDPRIKITPQLESVFKTSGLFDELPIALVANNNA